jgi:NADPH:quinone reductase-like Zn-dependent oxidoreductase
MKAVRIHRFGGPEVLSFDDLPMPEPRDGEVVVKVCAASVNPVDFKIREGNYPAVREGQLPVVMGRDISGIVATCGGRVGDLKEGSAVFAMLGQDRGGQAEYVTVKTSELAAKPDELSHVEAAAVPLAGLTAWQGLFDHGQLQQGQRVLILGASGGVGHFAVQFAKSRGCTVIATASGEGVDFVRHLAADQVIDYTKDLLADQVEPVDLVFDLVDGDARDQVWALVKKGGRLVSTLTEPSQQKAKAREITALRYTAHPSGAQLAEIAALIASKKVMPHVTATYPFEKLVAAEQELEKGHMRGKMVIQIAAA